MSYIVTSCRYIYTQFHAIAGPALHHRFPELFVELRAGLPGMSVKIFAFAPCLCLPHQSSIDTSLLHSPIENTNQGRFIIL